MENTEPVKKLEKKDRIVKVIQDARQLLDIEFNDRLYQVNSNRYHDHPGMYKTMDKE